MRIVKSLILLSLIILITTFSYQHYNAGYELAENESYLYYSHSTDEGFIFKESDDSEVFVTFDMLNRVPAENEKFIGVFDIDYKWELVEIK